MIVGIVRRAVHNDAENANIQHDQLFTCGVNRGQTAYVLDYGQDDAIHMLGNEL